MLKLLFYLFSKKLTSPGLFPYTVNFFFNNVCLKMLCNYDKDAESFIVDSVNGMDYEKITYMDFKRGKFIYLNVPSFVIKIYSLYSRRSI